MPTYATEQDLCEYVSGADAITLPGDSEAIEHLLERGERAVDLVLGPYERVEETGLKLDPEELDEFQSAALARATCAHVEWLLLVGPEIEAGDSDLAAGDLQVVSRPALVSPRVRAELAGFDLIRWSGTVVPEPKPSMLEQGV